MSDVPAAAESFDELYTRAHAAPQKVDFRTLVGERDALRGDYLEISDQATFVSIQRKLQGILRRGRGLVLFGGFFLQNAQRRQIVLISCSATKEVWR